MALEPRTSHLPTLLLLPLLLLTFSPISLSELTSDGKFIGPQKACDLATRDISDKYGNIPAAVVSPAADSVVFTAATKAGWNAQKCPNSEGFQPPSMGACTPKVCAKGGVPAKFQTSKLVEDNIGYVLYNGATNPTTTLRASAESCCNLCAATSGCAFWQFIPTKLSGVKFGKDKISSPGGGCFLEDRKMALNCGQLTVSYDVTSADASVQIRSGGHCNDDAKILNDPHLTGAHGTRFDFNGQPNKAFCLLSDRRVHVNMALRGYYDSRTEGASLLANGKAVRTWIRAIGLVFKSMGRAQDRGGGDDTEGAVQKEEEHRVVLTARDGKNQERGKGFLKGISVDGTDLPRLAVGEVYNGPGGLAITFVNYEKSGPFDVDYYMVEVAGLISLDVRLRIAHPLLQTPDDAETHINVAVTSIEPSDHIHGVLGQTYRPDHAQRAVDFRKIVAILQHPIAADTEEGKGFLDGHPEMYEVSDITATDCGYSAFDLPEKTVVGF